MWDLVSSPEDRFFSRRDSFYKKLNHCYKLCTCYSDKQPIHLATPHSGANKAGWSLTWSEIPKTGFLVEGSDSDDMKSLDKRRAERGDISPGILEVEKRVTIR